MPDLALEAARLVIDRAIAEAKQDFKRPICVSVCDPLGFLIAFSRTKGAPVRSIQISQGKAYTAVRMGVSTEVFLARIQKEGIEISYFCDPQLTALPGGSVLKDRAGTVVGGIGVSGLTSAEDQVIADRIAELVRLGQSV